ncbi:MAG: hypothetical protein IKV94_04995 [Clostridia bacterium]|nr:hypothetical protein [Clostridia bacterium]
MEETLSKFVTAIVAIFILFIFPVYIAYEKKDDISYALAVRYTQDFVDKVRSKGYITKDLYADYLGNLERTGNFYDVELEHIYVRYDGNEPDGTNISSTRNEEIFSTKYIENILNQGNTYQMNVNDTFNVTIKNTNVTLATVIYNIVTVNMSKSNVRVYVDYGGKILAEKWYDGNYIYSAKGGIIEIIGAGTGDVNGDGDINEADYDLFYKWFRGESSEGIVEKNADLNCNDKIDYVDVTQLLAFVTNKRPTIGCGETMVESTNN